MAHFLFGVEGTDEDSDGGGDGGGGSADSGGVWGSAGRVNGGGGESGGCVLPAEVLGDDAGDGALRQGE